MSKQDKMELQAPEQANIEALEKASAECGTKLAQASTGFTQAFAMAAGIQRFRQLLPASVIAQLLPLKDTALGFMTDEQSRMQKGQPAYSVETIRDCMIEAAMHGCRLAGNEFNILSGRCYVTKNGFARKVREHPGVTDLILTPGAVRGSGDRGAFVEFTAIFNLDGKPQRLERKGESAIPVRVNSNMGIDAIVGKAERKMLAFVHRTLTGSTHSMADGEVGEDDTPAPVAAIAPSTTQPALTHTERVKQELSKRLEKNGQTPEPTPEPKTPEPSVQEEHDKADLFAETPVQPVAPATPVAPAEPAAQPPVKTSGSKTFKVAKVLDRKKKDPETGERKTWRYDIIADNKESEVFHTLSLTEAKLAFEALKSGQRIQVNFSRNDAGDAMVTGIVTMEDPADDNVDAEPESQK